MSVSEELSLQCSGGCRGDLLFSHGTLPISAIVDRSCEYWAKGERGGHVSRWGFSREALGEASRGRC